MSLVNPHYSRSFYYRVGFGNVHPGYRLQGYRLQVTGYKLQVASRTLMLGTCNLEPCSLQPATWNLQPVTRS